MVVQLYEGKMYTHPFFQAQEVNPSQEGKSKSNVPVSEIWNRNLSKMERIKVFSIMPFPAAKRHQPEIRKSAAELTENPPAETRAVKF